MILQQPQRESVAHLFPNEGYKIDVLCLLKGSFQISSARFRRRQNAKVEKLASERLMENVQMQGFRNPEE